MNNKTDTVPLGRAIAVIAAVVLLCATLVSGSFFIAAARRASEELDLYVDTGISLNGEWHTVYPTVNNEKIIYIFLDNTFTMKREMHIADVHISDVLMLLDPDDIDLLIQEGDGVLLRTQTSGSFAISGNEIWKIVPGQDTSVLPFSWEDDIIIINDDIFQREL